MGTEDPQGSRVTASSDAPASDGPTTADTPLIDGALKSRTEESPWSVAWGKLPDGVNHVRVAFRNGRATQPAARVEVVGRHWAAEVAGRFDKVTVTGDGITSTAKVKMRELPSRRQRRKQGPVTDPVAAMKQHWGLAGLILQPGSDERPLLPDIRSASDD